MKHRNGLSESLESYASRMGLPVCTVRATWRAQGLNLLARERQPLEYWIPYVTKSAVRILPGVSIPTSNGPCVIETE